MLGLRYMVTGSVASIVYGEPRLTHDIDVILELSPQDIERFLSVFPEQDFYKPPAEVLEAEIARDRRGHSNIIDFDSGFKLDIYFPGKDRLILWGLGEAREINFDQSTIRIASIEYVIIQKLRFFKQGRSEKHIRDIQSMIAVSGAQLKRDEIERWTQKLNLAEEWEAIE